MDGAFGNVGIIILTAVFFGVIFSKVKQPALLGYVVAGLFLSFLKFDGGDGLEILSDLGITLLLFIIGLELDVSSIKKNGRAVLLLSLTQVILTTLITSFVFALFDFSLNISLLLGVAVSFSSTVLVVKLFTTRKIIDSFYGKLSLNILLIQDILVIFFMIFITDFIRNSDNINFLMLIFDLFLTITKGVLSLLCVYLFVKYIFNPFLNFIHADKEILFVTVLCWPVALALLFGNEFIGYTHEIGGLIAGIALASRFEHLQIEGWMRPLRDFFIMLFFVFIGLHVNMQGVDSVIFKVLFLTVLIIFIKFLVIFLTLKLFKYSKKISFIVGVSLAQVSEFSLILVSIIRSNNVIDDQTYTIFTLTTILSMFVSSFLIFNVDYIYTYFDKSTKFLPDLSDENDEKSDKSIYAEKEIILFGCHRLGRNLIRMLPKIKSQLLIVDLDPKNVKKLRLEGYDAVYGDVLDEKLYPHFMADNIKMIISTIPGIKDNSYLLEYIRRSKISPITVFTSSNAENMLNLYSKGADFVIYPHLLGSDLLAKIVRKGKISNKILAQKLKSIDFFEDTTT